MNEEIRAEHARELLDNPIFKESLEQVNLGINREMDDLEIGDKDGAYDLVQLRQAVNRVIQHIITTANTGKVTAFNAKKAKA
jgi:hypothetical protein